ncbi:MAG TPA: hypothetical protein VK308_03930 [Pyrinomonadaceae bacterium]|nr:hypothetical protein [Pyrinomonadaceae bacterium]
MENKKKKKYRFRKRIFLNEDFESSVYVVAIVENSKKRDASASCGNSDGGAKLIVESSYNGVSLDFELGLPDQAKESISKIKAFETLLKQFRKAVEKEAKARKQQSYEHIKDGIVTVR